MSIYYWGIFEWFRFAIVLTNLINMTFIVKEIAKHRKLYVLNKKITKMCVESRLFEEHGDLLKMRTIHLKMLLRGITLFLMIISCIVIVLL